MLFPFHLSSLTAEEGFKDTKKALRIREALQGKRESNPH